MVMSHIIGSMFNRKFIDEMFKVQDLHSRQTMRIFFEKLAHTSIMRLDINSMDKLFDLIVMIGKYQVQTVVEPGDLLLMTLNHLDGVRKLVNGNDKLQKLIDYAYKLLEESYFQMSTWELALIRTTLLGFFQDARIKLSMLLREKKQREDGHFIIDIQNMIIGKGSPIPGLIIHLQGVESTNITYFKMEVSITERNSRGSLEKKGERVTILGTNMYKKESNNTEIKGGVDSLGKNTKRSETEENCAKNELKLLKCLLFDSKKNTDENWGDFVISLFETENNGDKFAGEVQRVQENNMKIVKIDATKRGKNILDTMVGQLDVKDKKTKKTKGQDILDMMDEVEKEKPTNSKGRSTTFGSKSQSTEISTNGKKTLVNSS